MLVATFRAARWNWKEVKDEVTDEVQRSEKQQDEDTEDAFHPQDPIQEVAEKEEVKFYSEVKAESGVTEVRNGKE